MKIIIEQEDNGLGTTPSVEVRIKTPSIDAQINPIYLMKLFDGLLKQLGISTRDLRRCHRARHDELGDELDRRI